MDPVSTALITKSLDALALRQAYTAQNIANANTQNYRPASVDFEAALRSAADKSVDAIGHVEPSVRFASADAGEMRLDLQLATSARTAARYGALVEILSRQMAISRAAVGGGGGR